MLSVVILTKNEEKNIEECLKTLNWCDEVIVIDDNSKDKTCDIAKKTGARVFVRNLDDGFATQRNFGLEKANGDWVLFVDADERVKQKLRDEVNRAIRESGNLVGYFVKRIDVWKGKEIRHGEVGNIKLLRLAKKNSGKWKRIVHETWDIEGEKGELQSHLYHYPHPTVSGFISEVDKYSTLDAQEKLKIGIRSNLLKIIFWPILKFKLNYIFRLGFLDGTYGFLYACMMSLHSFLSWSKLWLLQKK